MVVRQATTEDVHAIQRVAEDAWHAAHDDIIGKTAVNEFLATHYNEEDILTGITNSDTLYYVVADHTEGVVGFVMGGPWQDSETTYVVGAIYIRPNNWGRGFGSRLLQRFEDEVRRQGGELVRLVVMAENDAAVNFYEAVGYERTDDHYDDDLDVHGYVYVKEVER